MVEVGAPAAPGEAPAAGPTRRGPARRGSLWRELPVLVVVALVLALLIKAFLVQAFFIPSGSMERTLHGCKGCTGDRVLVNKLLYEVRDIRRGEIVVFSGEGSWGSNTEFADGDTDYIKRVIGIGGDRVACCTPTGQVTVQPAGAPGPVALDEPYVFEDDNEPFCAAGLGAVACPPGAAGFLVPAGRLWVLGDHRSRSGDSRAHLGDPGQGTIPEDQVIGRAFVIVWPFARARVLTVPSTFQAP